MNKRSVYNIMLALLVSALPLTLSGQENQLTLGMQTQNAQVVVTENDKPILVYQYQHVPKKPYVLEWYSPAGENILRDAPDDHPHHHGLMFAITVDEVNFWEESETGGIQQHVRLNQTEVVTENDSGTAVFNELLEWRSADNAELMLIENRQIQHYVEPDVSYRLLTWTSELHAPADREQVLLSGTSYHGLGLRFPAWMDVVGRFTFSSDMSNEAIDGEHRLAQASWISYSVASGDNQKTVAMFNAPSNPHPALWFMMDDPFAFLSATIDLWRTPLELHANAPVTLTYGVAVWDEIVDVDSIEAVYAHWQDLLH